MHSSTLATCGFSSSNCCQYRDGASKDCRKRQGGGSVQWVMGLWERSSEFRWRVRRGRRRAYGPMQPPVLAAELIHTQTPYSSWDPPPHSMVVQPCSPIVPAFLLPCPWTQHQHAECCPGEECVTYLPCEECLGDFLDFFFWIALVKRHLQAEHHIPLQPINQPWQLWKEVWVLLQLRNDTQD